MARSPNKNGSERLYLRLSAQNSEHLQRLADLGVHGVTPSEVAKTLVGNEIERLIKDGFLKLGGKRK